MLNVSGGWDRILRILGRPTPRSGGDLGELRQPWAHGGPTRVDNLAPLCRRHHRIRHHSGWTHHPLPNGDHLWLSRLGHTYTTSGLPP